MEVQQVSVILPAYNCSGTIERAIDSILNQSYPNFELIIVENGSSDNTLSTIKSFDDERIRIFKLGKPNLVEALNFGIKKSKGEYLARMDADDWSYPERLNLQVTFLEQNKNIGLVAGLVEYQGNREQNIGYYTYVEWLNKIKSTKEIYLSRFQESALPHPTVMFRRSIGKKYGFYRNGNFPEDFELWNRWLDKGVRMCKVEQVVLDWYDQEYRLSRTDQNYQQENFSKIKAKYFSEWFKRKFNSPLPEIYVWGIGNKVRQKVKHLVNYGLHVSKFIDIKRSNSTSYIHYMDLSPSKEIFVLSYVNDRRGKKQIHNYLSTHGFSEGLDFYMME